MKKIIPIFIMMYLLLGGLFAADPINPAVLNIKVTVKDRTAAKWTYTQPTNNSYGIFKQLADITNTTAIVSDPGVDGNITGTIYAVVYTNRTSLNMAVKGTCLIGSSENMKITYNAKEIGGVDAENIESRNNLEAKKSTTIPISYTIKDEDIANAEPGDYISSLTLEVTTI